MDLRITLDTMVHRALINTRRQSDRLAVLHQQAATGKRLLEPSDDPVATVAVLANHAQDGRLGMYLGNVADARTILDISVSALTQAGNVLSRARQIAIEGVNPGNDRNAFEALATEVDKLLDRMLDISNDGHNGQHLYSGTAVHTQPFVLDPVTGTVRYNGAGERGLAAVSQNLTVDTFYRGSEVFMVRNRAATIFSGKTGATPGSGTDSATAQDTLQVRHTATTYAPGSGVAVGTSSAAGDTILGPAGAHQLTIIDTSGTGAAGTVSLNGGPAVAFNNADTNLMVTGPTGEVVFVNTTAITPTFNGNVAITANGTLSTDGGVTTVPITFAANQAVTDSVTGGVTHVNSTNIRRTGDEHVEYPGTFDVFQILQALRDDLRNTRGLSSKEQLESISGRIGEIIRVRDKVLEVVGQQAASLQNLEGLQARIEDVQLETRRLNADLEGADLSEVVLNLQAQENLFRLTLSTAARIFDQSLLDFLR
jgi:flagellar hook-associated protein 3 FlgL